MSGCCGDETEDHGAVSCPVCRGKPIYGGGCLECQGYGYLLRDETYENRALHMIQILVRSYGCWPVREVTDKVDQCILQLKASIDQGGPEPEWDKYPRGTGEYNWFINQGCHRE